MFERAPRISRVCTDSNVLFLQDGDYRPVEFDCCNTVTLDRGQVRAASRGYEAANTDVDTDFVCLRVSFIASRIHVDSLVFRAIAPLFTFAPIHLYLDTFDRLDASRCSSLGTLRANYRDFRDSVTSFTSLDKRGLFKL